MDLDQQTIPPQSIPGGQSGRNDEAKRAQEEETTRDLLSTILDTAARERLSRVALVSTHRAKQIENILLQMAQSGQLRGRVSEEQLIDLLNQMEEVQRKTMTNNSTIVYHRKKGIDEDFDI